jgi:hypothetical protein
MTASNSRNTGVIADFNSRRTKLEHKRVIITTTQCRVSLAGRTNILLDSQMKLHATALKPAATALGKICRLGDFNHAQQVTIETARHFFFANGHGELHVIDNGEGMAGHSGIQDSTAADDTAHRFNQLR